MQSMETIGDCARKYDDILHQIESIQAEISLLRNSPNMGEDYVRRIADLDFASDQLSREAVQVYALLAHSIAAVIHNRYRELMVDFVLRRRMRADIADAYHYNYYYLCHILAVCCRKPLLPLSEEKHGESISG